MPRLQARSFAATSDVRMLVNARIETVALDDVSVGHCRFDPGWRWSRDVGPLMGTASCPIRHVGYSMSGTVHVVMDDGQTLDIAPHSVFEIPPGHDKWVVGDEPWVTIDWGGSARSSEAALQETHGRLLATVLFTDIVESTSILERVGDAAWHGVLAAHHAQLRLQLNLFRGREVKTTGDGLLAVFDSPTRAVRCAAGMVAATASSEIRVRIGVHTGELELAGDDVRGIAVHTAARLLALGGPDDVIVSSTTAELLQGSRLAFEDAGAHELKGLGTRHVFRLVMPSPST